MTARIYCILQLCLAFTAICWNGGYPFLGHLHEIRSQALLYKYVLDNDSLSTSEREKVEADYEALTTRYEEGYLDKMKSGVRILFLELSPLMRLWLLFAVIIPILVLLQKPGARQAVWLLPLLAGTYAFDNWNYAPMARVRADVALFPSEATLVDDYLGTPLSGSVAEQRHQLTYAWQRYLASVWAQQTPADDLGLLTTQAAAGELRFTLARLDALAYQPAMPQWRYRHTPLFLALFVLWNTLFAWCTAKEACF